MSQTIICSEYRTIVRMYDAKGFKMGKITLEIPSGDKCTGCMFLSTEERLKPRCSLFGWWVLDFDKKDGQVDESTITKLSACPRVSHPIGSDKI